MAIERELKFRLAPRAAARAVQRLALGKPRPLSSIYFDTPARTLGSARAALRLRRDGARWLQAFKCEMTPGVRGEWEVPAPRGELDLRRFPGDEIRAASGVDLAALKVTPLFETRFKRQVAQVRVGESVVEVALDRGHVIAGRRHEPICELEIELKRGAPGALLRYAQSLVEPLQLQLDLESKAARGHRLALRQAAPPRRWPRPDISGASPMHAFSVLAGGAIEQAAVNARGVASAADPEYLHQLRVGLRRFRAMLAAFRALEPRSGALNRRRRAFSPLLGAARDWDVFVESLPAGAVRRAASKERARSRRSVQDAVRSPAFNEWLLRALRWLDDAPWTASPDPLAQFAAGSLDRLRHKALRAGADIDWRSAEARHALRIRVKRLRYACDAFAPAFPAGAARAYLDALERLQDDFGALNDIAVARRLMAGLPVDRALAGRLRAAERRLIARVPRDWRAFSARAPFWRADT